MLEQFKNSVPERLAMYISEKKVTSAAEAAAFADDYLLTREAEGISLPVLTVRCGACPPGTGLEFREGFGP